MGNISIHDIMKIANFEYNLQSLYYAKNSGFSAVRLLFLKYITDNFIGATTAEDMQCYAAVQKMLAGRNVEAGPDVLVPVLKIVDDFYALNGILKDSIKEYAKELFGLDEAWNRKNSSAESFKKIMEFLSSFDFEETDSEHSKGAKIADILTANIQSKCLGNRIISEYVSRKELGKLAGGILQVQASETFLDFASGIGFTTLEIVKVRNCNIVNYDIRIDNLAVAAMLYILKGYSNFQLNFDDTLQNNGVLPKADKIFVDPPLGGKIRSEKNGLFLDSALIAMEKAAESLLQNGVAVVTAGSGVLFGNSKNQRNMKEKLIKNGYLQAVISLPINFYGTGVCVNLLVLSKKENENVLFINGNNELSLYLSKDKKAEKIFTDEGIDKILNIIETNETIEAISRVVPVAEIQKNDYNLMPNIYVKKALPAPDITLEEIDKQLAALYAQIGITNQEKK